jgi:hypothetical protein
MPDNVIPSSPETRSSSIPETGPVSFESKPEQLKPPVEQSPHSKDTETAGPVIAPVPVIQTVNRPMATDLEKKVENILTEGLEETYRTMDPATQAKFKATGEATAKNISIILQQGKVKVQKIIFLIAAWLRIIPGINKYYLEQEAKIKAGKLIDLAHPPRQ